MTRHLIALAAASTIAPLVPAHHPLPKTVDPREQIAVAEKATAFNRFRYKAAGARMELAIAKLNAAKLEQDATATISREAIKRLDIDTRMHKENHCLSENEYAESQMSAAKAANAARDAERKLHVAGAEFDAERARHHAAQVELEEAELRLTQLRARLPKEK